MRDTVIGHNTTTGATVRHADGCSCTKKGRPWVWLSESEAIDEQLAERGYEITDAPCAKEGK